MKQLKYKKNSDIKILIVEDNVDTRNNIIEFLSKGGIKVLGADSIKEATQIYSANASDIELFLIDLKLPDGNGMDFLKAIKDESNSSHLSPIPKSIIINHFITEDVRRIGKQLGVIAFIEKPFDLYELMKEVNKTLNPCEGLIPSPFPI